MHVARLRDARPIAGGHKHETNQAYMMSVCEAYHFHAVMVYALDLSSSSNVCSVLYTHSREFMHVHSILNIS